MQIDYRSRAFRLAIVLKGNVGQNYNPLRNNVFTVEEMMKLKLVGRIIDEPQFKNEFEKTLIEYSNLPPESLKLSKELIRSNMQGTGYYVTAVR